MRSVNIFDKYVFALTIKEWMTYAVYVKNLYVTVKQPWNVYELMHEEWFIFEVLRNMLQNLKNLWNNVTWIW